MHMYKGLLQCKMKLFGLKIIGMNKSFKQCTIVQRHRVYTSITSRISVFNHKISSELLTRNEVITKDNYRFATFQGSIEYT